MNRLSIRSRVLVAISALLLVATQFLPLWKIELHAPQYPEGIGMLIRIDTLTGIKPADIDNLNGLNHYIGMQEISVDAFPALKVMPWVAGILAGLALLVALVGRRIPLLLWLGAVALSGMAGFAEFYRWTYRYGHELAPDAIIKVPGMTYQPPILGSKQLLNFNATSWPAVGGWLAVAAFILGVAALYPFVRRTRIARKGAARLTNTVSCVATVALVLLAGCDKSATPAIAYGRADCDVCLMRIVDNRFGGLAITAKGKTTEFDSIECLANFASSATGLRSIWVADFDHPGTMVEARDAWFVRKSGSASEMGANVLAFAPGADTSAFKARFGVAALSWSEVQELAKRNELREVAAAEHNHDH